jgi:glutathione peroxidase
MNDTFYQLEATNNKGVLVSLADFKDKVLLVVNTASACGFTPQYAGIEALYKTYQSKGFEVLAFPCNQFGQQEKGNASEIANFCDLNFNISFNLMEKVDVNGADTHPIYQHLKSQATGILGTKNIKWNFTKFLINKEGEVIKRFAPTTKPEQLTSLIEELLAQ